MVFLYIIDIDDRSVNEAIIPLYARHLYGRQLGRTFSATTSSMPYTSHTYIIILAKGKSLHSSHRAADIFIFDRRKAARSIAAEMSLDAYLRPLHPPPAARLRVTAGPRFLLRLQRRVGRALVFLDFSAAAHQRSESLSLSLWNPFSLAMTRAGPAASGWFLAARDELFLRGGREAALYPHINQGSRLFSRYTLWYFE